MAPFRWTAFVLTRWTSDPCMAAGGSCVPESWRHCRPHPPARVRWRCHPTAKGEPHILHGHDVRLSVSLALRSANPPPDTPCAHPVAVAGPFRREFARASSTAAAGHRWTSEVVSCGHCLCATASRLHAPVRRGSPTPALLALAAGQTVIDSIRTDDHQQLQTALPVPDSPLSCVDSQVSLAFAPLQGGCGLDGSDDVPFPPYFPPSGCRARAAGSPNRCPPPASGGASCQGGGPQG